MHLKIHQTRNNNKKIRLQSYTRILKLKMGRELTWLTPCFYYSFAYSVSWVSI